MADDSLREIRFSRHHTTGKELGYIAEAIAYGYGLTGDDGFTAKCCRLLEDQFKIPRVMLTPSCTAALEMAAMLLGIGPGDEVIMPSYTFVTTASAFVRAGATPVFVDICSDTLNINSQLIERAITSRTKAICPVHYAGVGCEMGDIMKLAQKHGLKVIEDAAQGVNAFYRDHALGSIGDLGTYSFHTTKNYTCGEGGALCINNSDLIEQAEIIYDKGTDRQKFARGLTDKYVWQELGSSFSVSQLTSAYLFGQLEHMERIKAIRQRIYTRYANELGPLGREGLLRLPTVPKHCKPNYHMFYVLAERREALQEQLKERGIMAVRHYVPLHSSPFGRAFNRDMAGLPHTDQAAKMLLRLPFDTGLTEDEQSRVILAIKEFYK